MKIIFCMVLIALMLSQNANAMFNHAAVEKERRLETERQIAQEQQRTGALTHDSQRLHVVISILSASVTVALVVGAAVGSKTRRDHETNGECPV